MTFRPLLTGLVILIAGFLMALSSPHTVKALDLDCDWAPLQNSSSEYNGNPAFCIGGFDSESQLQSSNSSFWCQDNCGGWAAQLINSLMSSAQSKTGASVVGEDDNGFYTCYTGSFDTQIKSTIDSCLQRQGLQKGAFTIGALALNVASPVKTITVPVTLATQGKVADAILGSCEPVIRAEVVSEGQSCSDDLRINVNLEAHDTDLDDEDTPEGKAFSYCEQVPSGPQRAACLQCVGGAIDDKGNQTKVFTALGCISVSGKELASDLVTILLGIAGGIALLAILVASFLLAISQGETQKVKSAKELITAAVSGLLFLIFSIVILEFLAVDIFKIPGLN